MFNLIKITCGVAQSIHPYLQQGLRRNGMLPLRPCQETVILMRFRRLGFLRRGST